MNHTDYTHMDEFEANAPQSDSHGTGFIVIQTARVLGFGGLSPRFQMKSSEPKQYVPVLFKTSLSIFLLNLICYSLDLE